MNVKLLLIVLILNGLHYSTVAQDIQNTAYISSGSPLRQIVNKISFGISSGQNFTFYKQNLEGYSIFRKNDEYYLIESSQRNRDLINGYSGWLANPEYHSRLPRTTDDQIIFSDSIPLKYGGLGLGTPIQLTLHYTIMDRIRLGFGASQEFHQFPEQLHLQGAKDRLQSVNSGISTGTIRRHFGIVGVKLKDYGRYTLALDAQIGRLKYQKGFATDTLDTNSFLNLGASFEYRFSKFARAVVRPSYQSNSYNLILPESGAPLSVNNPAVMVNVGLVLNYPNVKKCPLNTCKVRYMHQHSGMEFRGVNIFTKQTLKYGEGYPQNRKKN
jgi:hypothetical protein